MKSNKLLLSVVALALSGIATAAPRGDASVVVRYADLNLASVAGVASLYKRIRNAAESVCSPLETKTLILRDAYKQCVAEAVTNAVTAVGNGNLANYHAFGRKGLSIASNRS